jgi:hypothetical protein
MPIEIVASETSHIVLRRLSQHSAYTFARAVEQARIKFARTTCLDNALG